jgi:hypothetical protein
MLENAVTISEKLKSLTEAKTGADSATSLEFLRSEINKISTPLKNLASVAVLWRTEGVPLSELSNLSGVKNIVDAMSTRLTEDPQLTTLTNGSRWKELTKNLDSLISNTRSTQNNDWSSYFTNTFFGGLDPDTRSQELAKTPENQRLLMEYRNFYSNFIKYKNNYPTTQQMFVELREISSRLTQIKFEEDLPEGVRQFFDAANRGGAGLELLTNEVVEWLRNKDSLNKYIVRAKTN